MNINISIKTLFIKNIITKISLLHVVLGMSLFLSIVSIVFSYTHNYIIVYGDAESHLNIAKRIVHSLTPGFAQLGGIWLPLPHILMIPFVFFDPLWRSGLAGSIVSGAAFVISCVYLYKLTFLITKNTLASFVAFLVFALNPNILYMQTTPMTELPLILFFLLSTFFFVKYIKKENPLVSLIAASFFGFCATLTRYDGWFLVLTEAIVIILIYLKNEGLITFSNPLRKKEIALNYIAWRRFQGELILFATLAFFGIFLWLLWDFIILNDPFYFTNSEFSAKTQQANWLARGELPGYHDLLASFLYYFITSMSNSGIVVFAIAVLGFFYFVHSPKVKNRFLIVLILMMPFIFNALTLYLGQTVIFIPHITPVGFEWRLFNVRYGLLMTPAIAFFFSYLFFKNSQAIKVLICFLLVFQFLLYGVSYSKVLTLSDGVEGLSSAKRPNAEYWMAQHYDHGLVLIDDYARTLSIIRSNIPMQNVIYIGNKPYWEESFEKPEKYARWIIMQKNDDVWKNIYDNKVRRGRLFKYFEKVYTSPEILIFRKSQNDEVS